MANRKSVFKEYEQLKYWADKIREKGYKVTITFDFKRETKSTE